MALSPASVSWMTKVSFVALTFTPLDPAYTCRGPDAVRSGVPAESVSIPPSRARVLFAISR